MAPVLVPAALLRIRIAVVHDNGVDVLGAAKRLAGPVQREHGLLRRVAGGEVRALPLPRAAGQEGGRHGGQRGKGGGGLVGRDGGLGREGDPRIGGGGAGYMVSSRPLGGFCDGASYEDIL